MSLSSVAGALVHSRYSAVTVTSSLVFVGPGPVHMSLGPEFFNFDINVQKTEGTYYKTHSKSLVSSCQLETTC